MKVRWIAFVVLVSIPSSVRDAKAGPSYSLGRKALCAESAVEIHMEVDTPPPGPEDRRQKLSLAARVKAFASARIGRVVFAPGSVHLPQPFDFYLPERAWRAASARGSLHAIVFMRRLDGVPVVLFGVEGVTSDAAPGYRETRSALLRFARWRAGGNAASAVTEAERLLAGAPNDDVAELARDYLCSRKEVAAVERAWKDAAPGSPAASQRDRVRGQAEPVCRPEPDDCSVW